MDAAGNEAARRLLQRGWHPLLLPHNDKTEFARALGGRMRAGPGAMAGSLARMKSLAPCHEAAMESRTVLTEAPWLRGRLADGRAQVAPGWGPEGARPGKAGASAKLGHAIRSWGEEAGGRRDAQSHMAMGSGLALT